MRPSTSRYDDRRRIARWTILPALIAIVVAVALPANASAAPCPVNPGGSTTWIGGSGSFNDDNNWSNGGPSNACDAAITSAGSDTITMTGGANMKSLTLGGTGSTPKLIISVQGPNTNLNATTTGISIAPGASVTLTCPPSPGECAGGGGSGVSLNAGSSTITNKGTITVDPNSGTGASLIGNVDNTGTIDIEQNTRHQFGLLLNQGVVKIANGKVFKSNTEHCGNNQTIFKNDAGGTIVAEGTGTLDVRYFEQGDGSATGSSPVQMECGALKYTGGGDSKVLAYGGIDLSGESHANQSLTVTVAGANTNARLAADFTNGGSMTFTCPESGCAGGSGSGVGLNANGHSFVNAGSLTVGPASGTGAYIDPNGGSVTNTGTVKFEKSAGLLGLMTNQGKVDLANGATVNGGQIEQTGSGAEIVIPAGTQLSPAAPVKLKAGRLRGSGTISGTVENSGGVVAPGASPGTLTLNGYVQSAGGWLEIEVAGTGAGQYDTLVVGGGATLGGTLALIPSAGFAGSSAVGNSVPFLTYGTSVTGGFSTTTVSPPLSCGKAFTTSTDEGTKALTANVVAGGTACGGGSSTGSGGAAAARPISPPPPTPKKTCPKGKQLKKGNCVKKKCAKGKRLKRGRCVKKKQPKPKARARHLQ